MSAGVFNEELLKETDGKKYPSLKAIVEANEEGGQTCKDKQVSKIDTFFVKQKPAI